MLSGMLGGVSAAGGVGSMMGMQGSGGMSLLGGGATASGVGVMGGMSHMGSMGRGTGPMQGMGGGMPQGPMAAAMRGTAPRRPPMSLGGVGGVGGSAMGSTGMRPMPSQLR